MTKWGKSWGRTWLATACHSRRQLAGDGVLTGQRLSCAHAPAMPVPGPGAVQPGHWPRGQGTGQGVPWLSPQPMARAFFQVPEEIL